MYNNKSSAEKQRAGMEEQISSLPCIELRLMGFVVPETRPVTGDYEFVILNTQKIYILILKSITLKQG